MSRLIAVLLLAVSVSFGADFKQARVVDFQDVSEVGGGTVDGPSSNGISTTPRSHVASAIPKCEVTLNLDGKIYTALFEEDRHFQIADLQRGRMIPVKIEGKKIAMQRPSDGKEIKGKIVRAESEASPAQK